VAQPWAGWGSGQLGYRRGCYAGQARAVASQGPSDKDEDGGIGKGSELGDRTGNDSGGEKNSRETGIKMGQSGSRLESGWQRGLPGSGEVSAVGLEQPRNDKDGPGTDPPGLESVRQSRSASLSEAGMKAQKQVLGRPA